MKSFSIEAVTEVLDSLWPPSGADDWDAPGFSVNFPSEISKILLAVDVTGAVVAEAEEMGAELIVAHHPFLLRGTQNVNWDDLKGNVLQHAIRAGISIYSAHTNADIVENGVSDILAKSLGLLDVRPLVASQSNPNHGHGRIGHLKSVTTLEELASKLAAVLPFTARGVAAAGSPNNQISTVAVCGGAGDAFIKDAFESGADVYITSDLRHHPTLDAISRPRAEQSMALIDISHWAAESLWLPVASEQMRAQLSGVEVSISKVVTDPWDFSINRSSE